MSRFVVAGSPCSGKTIYVREHMQAGDVVYDYDTMHQALSGQASHQHDQRIRPYVLAARDTVLDMLSNAPEQAAWIITASPRMAELQSLQSKLGAELILLEVTREEAHRRCDSDGRPAEWHGYIDRWFADTDIAVGEAKHLFISSPSQARRVIESMSRGIEL